MSPANKYLKMPIDDLDTMLVVNEAAGHKPSYAKLIPGEAVPEASPQQGANARSRTVSGRPSSFVVPQHPAQPCSAHYLALIPGRVVSGHRRMHN